MYGPTGRSRGWRNVLDLAGRALWHVPGRFRLASLLGPPYSLRCVLFHHVADADSPFTEGLGIRTSCEDFEAALKFLTKYYTPVCLEQVLSESDGRRLPDQPVLVTFDDAYASIREVAAPLCRKYGIEGLFFVNAECIDNRQLALDNLVCYATNTAGLGVINAAAGEIGIPKPHELRSMKEVFSSFLPSISLSARGLFRQKLVERLGIDEAELSTRAQLYLTSGQLRELADFGVEIGNHTYSHVNCRVLASHEYESEIDRNKRELEALTGRDVRSFSVPYGEARDLPSDLMHRLQRTGHQAAFLVESRVNRASDDRFQLNRVSIKAAKEDAFFSEIEVLPRFRTIRNRLHASN